jgi:hypothetical protein
VGLIIDDDPKITVSDAVFLFGNGLEGNGGPPNGPCDNLGVPIRPCARFTIEVSAVPSSSFSIDFTTVDGTAVAPSDYTATSGSVGFAPCSGDEGDPCFLSQSVSVPIVGDLSPEGNETFFLEIRMGSPGNGVILRNRGLATIRDDDPFPTVSINDVILGEGGAFTFTVSLSQPSAFEARVDFATADGTALGGRDYTPASGVLVFPPGTTSLPVTIQTTPDSAFEADETFFVNLSNPTNATIADGQGIGTIANDDGPAGRTFASVTGDDENDCRNVLTPCRTFDRAIFQVAAGGEVIALRTGSYGGATITKSVRIDAPRGITALTTAGFTIAGGPSGVVVLRGLTLKALTVGSGRGILFSSGAALHIESCTFDGWAIAIDVEASGRAFVSDSTIRNSQDGGLMVSPSSGTSLVSVDRSRFEGTTAGCGVSVATGGKAVVRNAVAAGNSSGLCASGGGSVDVQRTLASNNTGSGVTVTGAASARVSQSAVLNNGTGFDNSGGTFESLGNNLVAGNGLDTSGVITVIAPK